jgi:hypothetical protein
MKISGKRGAILATHGFEQSELEVPLAGGRNHRAQEFLRRCLAAARAGAGSSQRHDQTDELSAYGAGNKWRRNLGHQEESHQSGESRRREG